MAGSGQTTAKYVQLEKQGDTGLYHVARIKQWLGYLRKEYTEATDLFGEIRALKIRRILRWQFSVLIVSSGK